MNKFIIVLLYVITILLADAILQTHYEYIKDLPNFNYWTLKYEKKLPN